ncbi:hypothetical protein [Pedobacter sp. CFBP9032]|nr:hypothetical protein [Pedobacter sp. CFBP9032]MDY0906528.1 hypothetical protein [Pedobacter sp. CFBP9032]
MNEEIIYKDGKAYKVIYTRYITRKGKRIYHPKGGVFRFEVAL